LKPGDMLTLEGDLGVGKTTFARAVIRELLSDPSIEAPSPTFTLMQVYESDTARIVHADFYRIETVAELAGLGWDEEVEDSIVLVEWADRAPEVLPPDSPLHSLDNIILTSHTAWYSEESKRDCRTQAIERLLAALKA
jgi:hypothetical protein